MQKILVLDNYDSFTYNLVHFIEKITQQDVDVYRNDQISLDEIDRYDTIICSPGPGLPDDAGILKQVIKQYAPTKKVLGVCLGMQAMSEVYGAELSNLDKVYHGVATEMQITKSDEEIFRNVPNAFQAGRYHSWVVNKSTLPECFDVTAVDEKGELMAISHKQYKLKGVQFHPESILTPDGETMIRNFLEM